MSNHDTPHLQTSTLAALSLASLGVVYGDIGTSPLYALRECFAGPHSVAPTEANVFGVLSLIVWSLVVVISVKYLLLVMRADNDGEGGILALLALVTGAGQTKEAQGDGPEKIAENAPSHSQREGGSAAPRRSNTRFILIGLFGAALLYGDGIITPAISVLSAAEGLNVATPALESYVAPLTIAILVVLFYFQRFGSQGIGFVFGPVMLVWFVLLAALGAWQIVGHPAVLYSISPVYAARFFIANRWTGFLVLGVVFLVVTGGEALYADMGHFGRPAIRTAWFVVVLPALLLNYMGQGALILGDAQYAASPFYHLAPRWLLYPLVALATAATVIASQAVITGAFSLTTQAVQLGYLPRLEIRHTSSTEYGQVYLPVVNAVLLVFTVAVVLGFRSSSRLAAAYGVAVTTTMVITTMLIYLTMRTVWRWNRIWAISAALPLLVVDLSFFLANISKFWSGGWFPLLIAAAVMTVMTTWRSGRELLGRRMSREAIPYDEFFKQLDADPPHRVSGTEVHLTTSQHSAPPALVRNIWHNRVLHEQVAAVTVVFERRPHVRSEDRVTFDNPRPEFFRICLHYGFNQRPNVPRALAVKELEHLQLDHDSTTYVLGRETLFASRSRPGLAWWRELLFVFMARNSFRAAEYFHIPAQQVLEIGSVVVL